MIIKKIYSRQVAFSLIAQNNKLEYTEPNEKFPKFSVFCFEQTDKLMVDLTMITMSKK